MAQVDSSHRSNAIVSLAAADGSSVEPRSDGAVWNFTQDVLVRFAQPLGYPPRIDIDPSPEAKAIRIDPLQVELPPSDAARTLEIRWQKRAATTYRVTLSRGSIGPAQQSFTIRTPDSYPTPQAPVISKRSDPYYYGSLEHSAQYPFGLKLPASGRIDPRALAALTGQGIHFVRFGPTPTEVASRESGPQSRQSYSFTSTDPTIDALHKAGIEVLYVIDAGAAPRWANPNTAGDRRPIFETPALYAEYCSGVATHLAQTYPTIRRVEIGTNEPNYPRNWTNAQATADGMPENADQTGSSLARYLLSCYSAVKKAAPQISVVAPGIALGGKSNGFLPFVDALYRAGCRTGKCWDIFSLHSYTWSDPSASVNLDLTDNLYGPGDGPTAFYSYKDLQKRAVADGEQTPLRIMITETGFSSYPRHVDGVAPELQAYYTSVAFNQYLRDPTVAGIVWADVVQHERGGLFSGIATSEENQQPKPVFNVLRTFCEY